MEILLHLKITVQRRFRLRHLRLVFLHSMSEFYQFTRNLPHKPGYTVILRLPTYHTLLCTGQCQLFHGTGNAYIAQAALFFHVGRIS